MARALELAARGRCTTQPNPRVGCVIVKNGEVVGEGFHARAGGPHAEIEALRNAGERARGADLYVTLEPCCHHGRTPPCTEALVKAGVRRVIAAMHDPNPRVAGQGAAALRAAGIDVDVGLLEREAEALNRGFVSRMRRGRPFVSIKLAASLDGRTAMASGESRWISGPESRADVHRLRAEAGAVIGGASTVIADDPRLDARDGPPGARVPDRVVLDTQALVPAASKVWAPGARRLWLVGKAPAQAPAGVEVLTIPLGADGRIDLAVALERLAVCEINEAFVEAGPRLAGAFLRLNLADELVVYVAPSLLGHEARPLVELPGLVRLDQRLPLAFTDVARIGPDLRLTLDCSR